MKKEIVMGCLKDERPLLTRWHLLTTPWFRLHLHLFHRSDLDRALHDHPWEFYSLILWGGYTEVRPKEWLRILLELQHNDDANDDVANRLQDPNSIERVPYFPGALLHRPAWWAHRIEVPTGKKSISLVLVKKKTRDWGFFGKTWIPWRIFTSSEECG